MTVATEPARGIAPGEAARLRAGTAERVRDAATRREPLRITGCGTWLDAGRPVRAAAPLDLGALSGIVEYAPGDLTLTALAGTPLSALAAATRAEGQWLALDPAGGDGGSLGATVATASSGALAHSAGTPRDNVLGLEVVTGTGDVVRAGGRVVKNVAGFDLVRLNTGAWGTLGAITEVTVRLRALPAVDETVALALPREARAVAALLAALREAALQPLALELLSGALARHAGAAGEALVLVRLGGNEELVRAQAATLRALGDLAPVPTAAWDRLRDVEPAGAITARASAPPSRLATLWLEASRAADDADGWAHASVARGIARVVLPAADPAGAVAALHRVRAAAHAIVGERMPGEAWRALAPSAVDDALSRGVRRAFDPLGLLNPGILGEALP